MTVTGSGLAPNTTGSITVGTSTTVQGTASINSLGAFTGTFVASVETKNGGRVAVADGAGILVSSNAVGCGVTCVAAATPLYVQKASATPRVTSITAGSILEIDLFDFTVNANNVIANLGATVGGVAVSNSPASSFAIPTGASAQFSPHKILIPANTTTGTKNVVITESGGGGTKNATFQISVAAQTPGSLSLAPAAAVAGQSVTVTGSNFTSASVPGGAGPNGVHQITGTGTALATLGGIPLPSANLTYPVNFASNGNFVATIVLPVNATTLSEGTTELKMTDTAGKTGKINLTISARTLALNPASSPRGSMVEVTGAGFATGNLPVQITYSGEVVASASPDQTGAFKVSFRVPLTGSIPSTNRVVASTVTGLVANASANHEIPGAMITVSPTSGPPGSMTTVTASNFSGFAVVSSLTIGGVTALPLPAPGTDGNGSLVTLVRVPSAPVGTQSLLVTVGGVSAVASFTVTAALPTDPVEVFAEAIVADPGLQVWGFPVGRWQFFNAALPPNHPANDLVQVVPGDGVWIFNSTTTNITTTILSRTITLLSGWNLKGL